MIFRKPLKNVLSVVTLLVALLVSSASHAEQQRVDETKAAQADGTVRINVVRGEISIEGWNRNEVMVKGLLDEELEEFIFDVDGAETGIEVRIPRNNSSWHNRDETDLVIHVPENSNIAFRGVSVDVDANRVRGNVEIGVVSGDVDANGGTERIVLQTVSGDIDVREVTGRIKVKTVSGDIESYNSVGESIYGTVSGDILVEGGGEDLKVETVSGDIEILRTDFVDVSGHSVSGDVDVRGNLKPKGVVEFDNVSGSIRLGLQGTVNARIDLETGSGSIRNRLSDDKPKASKYVRDESLRFTLGDGTGEIVLSTRSGDITVSNR
jgi:DUF4097 and DUF4098 domain-containing protein YvlB